MTPPYFVLPSKIASLTEISGNAKVLYATIFNFCNMDGKCCTATNNTLMQASGLTSISMLNRALRELQGINAIESVVERDTKGTRRSLYNTLEHSFKRHSSSVKNDGGGLSMMVGGAINDEQGGPSTLAPLKKELTKKNLKKQVNTPISPEGDFESDSGIAKQSVRKEKLKAAEFDEKRVEKVVELFWNGYAYKVGNLPKVKKVLIGLLENKAAETSSKTAWEDLAKLIISAAQKQSEFHIAKNKVIGQLPNAYRKQPLTWLMAQGWMESIEDMGSGVPQAARPLSEPTSKPKTIKYDTTIPE